MTVDVSKIPMLTERREAGRLWNLYCDESEKDSNDVAADKAYATYCDFDAPAILQDGATDRAAVCAISGVPVFIDDEYLIDEETGEVVLRMFTGLPPRPEVFEDEETEDDEAMEMAE